MKQAKWSQIDGLCKAVEAVAGGDTRCWVEHAGDAVAGDRPDRLITPSTQTAGGSEGAEVIACVSGRASRVWIDLLATAVRNDLTQQSTIHDMAAATARAWRQMNALLTMASSSSLGIEAGKTIQRIFDQLVRATRFDGGIAVVRVPGSDDCLQLDATGVQRLPEEIVDGLEQVGAGVYTFLRDGDTDDLRRACIMLLDPYQPAAVARLQTENQSYGWLLAAAVEDVSSDDLKLFGAAARLTAVALENSHTLTLERAAARADVEKELYQTLAKTAPVGMFRTDAGGQVIYVNDRWCRVTGTSEAEALREGWLHAVHPDDRARVADEWERMLVEGTPVRCEHRCRRSDRIVWGLTEIAREVREDGGFVGTLTDITDRKRAEREKAELEEHLRHAQKMEAVGTMAGGIAHDFNNILGAIVGNAELAAERVPEGDRARVHLDRLLKGAFRARELISQLLAFSRQTERVRVSEEAAAVVAEAVDLIRASIPPTIELQTTLLVRDARVSADAGQLHQVILNLCRNACEAIGDGPGRVMVELDRCDLDAQAPARLGCACEPGRYVRVVVSDSGPGVSPEARERIFEPFFTTKPTRGGSGMGLAMVHGIVADHGGFVCVTDAAGGGACFEVYLPELGAPEQAETVRNEHIASESGEEATRAAATSAYPSGTDDSNQFDDSTLESSADEKFESDDGSLEDLVAAFLAEEEGAVARPAHQEPTGADTEHVEHCLAGFDQSREQGPSPSCEQVPSPSCEQVPSPSCEQVPDPSVEQGSEQNVEQSSDPFYEQSIEQAGLSLSTASTGAALARLREAMPAQSPRVLPEADLRPDAVASPEIPASSPARDPEPAAEPASLHGRDEGSLLERLVAEFLAEEKQASDAEAPKGATASSHAGCGTESYLANRGAPQGATVPALRGAGVPARSRLVAQAPEFKPGHARLLGAGRARSAGPELAAPTARPLPCPSRSEAASGATDPAQARPAPHEDSPLREDASGPLAPDLTGAGDRAARAPLPFPYGLPHT